MPFVRLIALLGCLAALTARVRAEECNVWPVHVAQKDATGKTIAWDSVGPLFFSHPTAEGGSVSGFRPFFVEHKDSNGMTIEKDFLYPIFIYRADDETHSWRLLQLINRSSPKKDHVGTDSDQTKAFDLWPFWFSRQTGSPETSYHAFFPVAGTVKNRFQHDELAWVIWPLYLRTEKNGAITTSTPWPFIQTVHGTDSGFALWPLFGWHDAPERYHRSFFLWPLGWNNTLLPPEDAPVGTAPTKQSAFLPFYSRETGPGFLNESYLWPFFGESTRTVPFYYHETRYLWPFLVQGHGDGHLVNRWGPVYTHSIHKGVDKTWYLWPFVKQMKWDDTDAGVAQTKTQFLYLLYWNLEQRSLTNPSAAPGHRMNVWPLFSHLDNGAGRREFQLFSPFDVFWPNNEQVKASWTPLFAIYRSERLAPDQLRWSLLWNAVTWRHAAEEKEFHLGPLFSVRSQPAQKRVAFLGGLFGWQRDRPDGSSHVFWFDFSSKASKVPVASAP